MSDLQLPSSAAGWYDFSKMLSSRSASTITQGFSNTNAGRYTASPQNLQVNNISDEAFELQRHSNTEMATPTSESVALQDGTNTKSEKFEPIYESPGQQNGFVISTSSGAIQGVSREGEYSSLKFEQNSYGNSNQAGHRCLCQRGLVTKIVEMVCREYMQTSTLSCR